MLWELLQGIRSTGQSYLLEYISSTKSWCCWAWWMPAAWPPDSQRFYTIRNRLPSEPSHDRERIGQYFWLKWHFSSIYSMILLPKPWATNKEDGIIAFDWPAILQLEMKCPVMSYRCQTSFVQPEKWGHFSSLSLSGYRSLSWMMPLNAQLPQYEYFTCTVKGLLMDLPVHRNII